MPDRDVIQRLLALMDQERRFSGGLESLQSRKPELPSDSHTRVGCFPTASLPATSDCSIHIGPYNNQNGLTTTYIINLQEFTINETFSLHNKYRPVQQT